MKSHQFLRLLFFKGIHSWWIIYKSMNMGGESKREYFKNTALPRVTCRMSLYTHQLIITKSVPMTRKWLEFQSSWKIPGGIIFIFSVFLPIALSLTGSSFPLENDPKVENILQNWIITWNCEKQNTGLGYLTVRENERKKEKGR